MSEASEFQKVELVVDAEGRLLRASATQEPGGRPVIFAKRVDGEEGK